MTATEANKRDRLLRLMLHSNGYRPLAYLFNLALEMPDSILCHGNTGATSHIVHVVGPSDIPEGMPGRDFDFHPETHLRALDAQDKVTETLDEVQDAFMVEEANLYPLVEAEGLTPIKDLPTELGSPLLQQLAQLGYQQADDPALICLAHANHGDYWVCTLHYPGQVAPVANPFRQVGHTVLGWRQRNESPEPMLSCTRVNLAMRQVLPILSKVHAHLTAQAQPDAEEDAA